MLNEYEDVISGYQERMRRIALFEPLKELAAKRHKDKHQQEIDMRGLGMLTLLFFFERRLTREYKTGISDLIAFLQDMTRDVYAIEQQSLEKIARDIVQVFRPSTGKRRVFEYFNWETKATEYIEYSMLKDNGFDAKSQTQYYTLDEDGLAFLFATKEFYGEFQISINQLLLKQQIKKGEFHSALRQIREMEIDVDMLKDHMEKVKLEILRSIVSEETFERYKKLLEDTYQRFEREDEEFKALTQFITETRDALHTGNTKQQSIKSYRLMIQIAKELEQVHYAHAKLLELTSDLRTTALATAQESLYYTGIQTFNFDQDIVTAILAKPMHPEKMQGVSHPFLQIEENPIWSPLTVFAEQNIIEDKPDKEVEAFKEASNEGEHMRFQHIMSDQYKALMEAFMNDYEAGHADTLKQWMNHLSEIHSDMIHKRYFYSFWLLMHQLAPITNDKMKENDSSTILKGTLEVLKNRYFDIQETDEIIQFVPKYSIQNMTFQLEVHADELS